MCKYKLSSLFLFLCLLMGIEGINAQNFRFQLTNNVPVSKSGVTLHNAWAGGINAGQFQTLDMNQDGIEDLLVHEKTTGRLIVFLASATPSGIGYTYAPGYEQLFPGPNSNNILRDYIALRDYDCDGKKDLFADNEAGFTVYKNTTPAGGPLSWTNMTNHTDVRYNSGVFNYNLNIYPGDYPAFEDVDGDGDIDLLTFYWNGGVSIEYYRNMSVENHQGDCSYLEYDYVTGCFGQFTESALCSNPYTFNATCKEGEKDTTSARPQHAGSAVTYFDVTGNGSKDLLIGDIGCQSLYMLPNKGSDSSPIIDTVNTSFPGGTVPVYFDIFPVAFMEDLNFDGVVDMLVAPNVYNSEGGTVNFSSSAWFYENVGTNASPNYQYVRSNFLQETMIEQGEQSHPALVDYDGDGDLDLFIGNWAKFQPNLSYSANIARYENVGTPTSPSFLLADEDFLGLSSSTPFNLRPFFFDYDNDGKTDLVYTLTDGNGTTLNYISNSAPSANSPMQLIGTPQAISVSGTDFFGLASNNTFAFADLDGDGDIDMLLGQHSGNLNYFQRTASGYTRAADSAAGISMSSGRGAISPLLADMNGDGLLDLAVNSSDGVINLYSDILPNLNSAPIGNSQILENQFNSSLVSSEFKMQTSLAAGDLNGDGLPEVIVGGYAGGLNYLKNTSLITTLGAGVLANETGFAIYPNPAKDQLLISTESSGDVSIHDIAGRQVTSGKKVKASDLDMDVSILSPGLYMVSFLTVDGRRTTRKLIVQ